MNDPRENEPYAGKSDTVAPHTVLSPVRIRIPQPLADLIVRLGLFRRPHDFSVSFKHIPPKIHILFGGDLRAEVGTPPDRETLQSGTLGWSEPPHGVALLNRSRTSRRHRRL